MKVCDESEGKESSQGESAIGFEKCVYRRTQGMSLHARVQVEVPLPGIMEWIQTSEAKAKQRA